MDHTNTTHYVWRRGRFQLTNHKMDIKPLLVAKRLSARLLIVQCGQLTFVCTYIYVCMYVCVYIYIYIYIYIDISSPLLCGCYVIECIIYSLMQLDEVNIEGRPLRVVV